MAERYMVNVIIIIIIIKLWNTIKIIICQNIAYPL